MVSLPLTNGHGSPYAADTTMSNSLVPHSDSDISNTYEAAVSEPASDADAPGEEDDEDVEMVQDSDSSDDVDAEGEADGDYDSESPPPEQAESDDARSSASQGSSRPSKRKASPEGDDYITQNPELYGLRRSVRGLAHLLFYEANCNLGSRQASSSSRKPPLVGFEMMLTSSRSIVVMMMMILALMCLANASAQPRAKVSYTIHLHME